MSSADMANAALREKNKGNEVWAHMCLWLTCVDMCTLHILKAYRSGDHQEALVYYTRSIKFHPTAAAFNNRAITGAPL